MVEWVFEWIQANSVMLGANLIPNCAHMMHTVLNVELTYLINQIMEEVELVYFQ